MGVNDGLLYFSSSDYVSKITLGSLKFNDLGRQKLYLSTPEHDWFNGTVLYTHPLS